MKSLALAVLKLYSATQPLRPPRCRFYPSCSRYMAGCIQEHGLLKGAALGLLRLAKCHPLHPGGVDEVPPAQMAISSRVRG